MNLTSALVGVVVMGLTAPLVAQTALQPAINAARSTNFAAAEATATAFAAKARETNLYDPAEVPPNCDVMEIATNAYTITCVEGLDTPYEERVARSFEVIVANDDSGTSSSGTKPPKEGPYTPGVYCPDFDPDGTLGFDNDHNVNCNPNAWWHHDPDGGPP